MCGIAGYIGRRYIDEQSILSTLERMKNRGPDDRSFFRGQQGDAHVTLLHSRLSIIDLDARANQPFTIGDCTVVFNGEIYNYLELRRALEQRGVTFHTASDTEVLLQYYLHYGEDCVQHFEGMWSFAIYDRRQGTLLLSRDRFAEKPLYYVQSSDGIYFGSEIKFLKSLAGRGFAVNQRQVLRYITLGYKSLYKKGETFFEEVHEVPYASSMTVGSNLRTEVKRYWKPESTINTAMTMSEAIEGTRYHLIESMKIRLRADVPLAFCLSGGVDSSSLVSIAAKVFNYDVAAFSILDSDERYNEYDNIMATIQDTECNYTLINIPQDDALPRLRRLIEYHDAPVATITYYVHSMLSEAISNNGYRVAFSGTSADELFTGYYDHFLLHLYEMRHHQQYERYLREWREHIAQFIRNPILSNPDLYKQNPDFREHVFDNSTEFISYLKVPFSESFTEKHFCNSLLRNRMMNELFHEATPVILHEDDLNSMLYSIENRSPFLDSRLFAFANTIPAEHLIQNGYGKYLLREAMKGILNEQVRTDRRKRGFNASINSMIDLHNPENRAYLLDEQAAIFELIDRSRVAALFDMESIPNHYSKFLFSFINARIFLELN